MRPITQDAFDEAVRENITEFEMGVDEAITDTIQQFEAQGVDLSNIITDLMASNIDGKPVTEAVIRLKNLIDSNKPSKDCLVELNIIKSECDRGIQYRVIAGKEGVYHVIMDAVLKRQNDLEVFKACFITLTALMTKQPDLLDARGIQTMINCVDKQKDQEVLKLVLRWVKECCVLHEQNRQHIFDAAILDHLKPLLSEASSGLLRDVLGVLRALVLDDDIRVEFGKAHEHARTIASDMLCAITALLEKFKMDEPLMNDLLATISSLLVRTEFCKKVEDAGSLQIIQEAMVNFQNSDKIIRECFKVLKALAGNDDCKAHIIKNGAAPVIVSSLAKHMKSVQTAVIGLGCVSALTLRDVDNSKALFEAGLAPVIVDAMRLHPDNELVQKNASWAVRNMVSRSRYQNKQFLTLGVEELLKSSLKKFKKYEYDFKAALRDLECEVDLKEEWTGKGGKLHTDASEKVPRK